MPINRVHKLNNQYQYFITPTIKNWYYLFDRHNRWQIIAESIIYCQKHKNLKVYAYVFMLNHLHMIVQSPDMIGFVRDFKRHTSKELIKNIKEFEPNVLRLFKNEDGGFSIWKEDNAPKILESEKFSLQKLNYIHNNPVMKGYVQKPEYWSWSSANPHSLIKVEAW
jgi:REP element-mobilizing transposase RayT